MYVCVIHRGVAERTQFETGHVDDLEAWTDKVFGVALVRSLPMRACIRWFGSCELVGQQAASAAKFHPAGHSSSSPREYSAERALADVWL